MLMLINERIVMNAGIYISESRGCKPRSSQLTVSNIAYLITICLIFELASFMTSQTTSIHV